MKIGIDAGPLLGEGGISGYVTPLIRALIDIDREASYHLLLRGLRCRDRASSLDQLAPVTRLRVPDRIALWWWNRLGLTLPLERDFWNSLDLFIATNLIAPVLPRGHLVTIVYDLIPLRLPEHFPRHGAFATTMARAIERSSALVAISHSTKRDLVECMGADAGRIRVIHAGCRHGFRPVSAARSAEVASRYGIHGRYILYVGSLGPHKNVATLLRAYQQARLEYGVDAQLAVVGDRRWGKETLAVLESLRVKDTVVLTGRVPEENLAALYSGAEVFVFPSFYEGFGLPVLEAMACGAPVITSDRGALREVAGAAAIYIDPRDEAGLAARIQRLLTDPEQRRQMAEASLAQAQRFHWQRSACQLSTLLHELAGEKISSDAGITSTPR
ncbi:MAG: glycosyltransferase family 4 protein [Acidobacteriota bacterium]